MRRALAVAALALPSAALACGGFFARNVEVSPDQSIVVVHRDGVETYVFRPRFCGEATDFGVILPIPAALSAAPALADDALFDQLGAITTPKVVEECIQEHSTIGCGSPAGGIDRGIEVDGGVWNGVGVLERGRVGVFDYVLLQATSATAFTDWLDANGFPHGAASDDAYASYVERRWYFVAFKVSTGGTVPDAGQKLCGDLGPIALSFPTQAPVVPARIAGVNGGGGTWRLFTIAAHQQALDQRSAAFFSSLYFAGTLDAAMLSSAPATAALARASERLTALDVTFRAGPPPEDLWLTDGAEGDFRTTRTVYKHCGPTCSAGPGLGTGALLALGLWLALRRGRRARAA